MPIMSFISFLRQIHRRIFRAMMMVGITSLTVHAQIYTEREIGIFRVPINNWNMKANRYMEVWFGASSGFPLPSGVETAEIIGASVTIYNDAQSQVLPLMFLATNYTGAVSHEWKRGGGFVLSCNDVNSPATARCVAKLDRGVDQGNYFSRFNNGADYDATGFRGWITVEYLGAPTAHTRIYRKLGTSWGIPSALVSPKQYVDKNVSLTVSAPTRSMLDMDATLHSDPPSGSPSELWVEPLGIAGGAIPNSGSEFYGRGGSLWGTPNFLTVHIPYSHMHGGTAGLKSRFHQGLHTSNSNNRGWVRITTESPQSYSNPFFMKTRVWALGPMALTFSGSLAYPLAGVAYTPQNRVVEVSGFLFKDPEGALAVRDASTFGRMPPLLDPALGGNPRIGGKIQLEPGGSINMIYAIHSTVLPREVFWSSVEQFDDETFNRGWLRVDYLAAQCGEGEGFTRTAIGYIGNVDDCHGNFLHPGTGLSNHVIQTKGSGIRETATSDAFFFAHKAQSSVTVTTMETVVDAVENTSSLAKAGLMIRQVSGNNPPAANAVHLSLMVTPGNEIQVIYRPTANQANQFITKQVLSAPPFRLRMVKLSNTSYRAEVINSNGTLTQLATVSLPSGTYQVGVAAANGGSGSTLCTVGLSEGNF